MLGLFPQHSLQLIPEAHNRQAIQAADEAYVKAQEAERLARVAEVLPELRHTGGGLYMVGKRYRVDLEAGTCSCPDFARVHSERHPIRCKHLLAARQAAGTIPKNDSGISRGTR
jgi:predicted nucleic acid-binding Zn finger protein